MGSTCHIVGIKCAPVQESSAHNRSWHTADTQERCLHSGYAVGMLDHIMGDMLTSLETQTSCKPSQQFRWCTSFSMPTPEEVTTRKVKCLQVTGCKSLHSVDRPKVVPHSAVMSGKVQGSTDRLDPTCLIRKWPYHLDFLGWVIKDLWRPSSNLQAQTLILLRLAPILWRLAFQMLE